MKSVPKVEGYGPCLFVRVRTYGGGLFEGAISSDLLTLEPWKELRVRTSRRNEIVIPREHLQAVTVLAVVGPPKAKPSRWLR